MSEYKVSQDNKKASLLPSKELINRVFDLYIKENSKKDNFKINEGENGKC